MSDHEPFPQLREIPGSSQEQHEGSRIDPRPLPSPQHQDQPSIEEQDPLHDIQHWPSHQHRRQPSIVEEEVEEDGENEQAETTQTTEAAVPAAAVVDPYDEKPETPSPSDACTASLSHDGSEKAHPKAVNERIEAHRVEDELEMIRAERQVDEDEENEKAAARSRVRMHNHEPEDVFNAGNSDKPPEKRKNENAVLWKLRHYLRKWPASLRYIVYTIPGALLLLAPVLLGKIKRENHESVAKPHGVQLMWFGVWLEIVWCSLWASRMLSGLMPRVVQTIAKVFGSCNDQKWRETSQRLELHLALLLWTIAMFVSFKPLMNDHPDHEGRDETKPESLKWVDTTNKVLIALLVLGALNFGEKILIYWITTTFHQRTYAIRTEINEKEIRLLTQIFEYIRREQPENGPDFWTRALSRDMNGTSTPLKNIHHNARQVLGKVGHVAGKVGNDLIGRKVKADQSKKIVLLLLKKESSARTLGRQIYQGLVRQDQEMIHFEDIKAAIPIDEDADYAFNVFDKDQNGDVSASEIEEVCNEIHLEKKAIASSLKDLDSVIEKLDRVFFILISAVALIVFICIVSKAGAAGLTSAGTSILGLAWMLQATAQEFLQSIIFVFIKHPFDVGDRVTIYGSTGASLTGDDYYVTEISLLYTEFRKMQGHIVQAPNSLLNTLFILNQRRSTTLTDSIPLVMRFGTPAEQIEKLKARMVDFVKSRKRDYGPRIITEITGFDQVRSCTMNMVFFHRSNFQNEILRLQRHNNFATELMHQMVEIGIESPLRLDPGGSREYPAYWTNLPTPSQSRPREPDPPAPSSVSNRSARARGYSVRSELATVDDDLLTGSFQDVYDHRREQVNLRRLESIRERDRGIRREEEAIQPTGQTPIHSAESTRSRFFGRTRSRTVSSAQNEFV